MLWTKTSYIWLLPTSPSPLLQPSPVVPHSFPLAVATGTWASCMNLKRLQSRLSPSWLMMRPPALSTVPSVPPALLLTLTLSMRRRQKKQEKACSPTPSRHPEFNSQDFHFFVIIKFNFFGRISSKRDFFFISLFNLLLTFVITHRAVSPCPLYEPEGRFAS